jgi:hypothetical protein
MENCFKLVAKRDDNGDILLQHCKLAKLHVPHFIRVAKEDAQILADSLAECGVRAQAKTSQHPPELIQGYTAEQWQEIIDGGYLCEVSQFKDFASFHMSAIEELRKHTTHNFVIPRLINSANCYSRCRPAQIKGVLRPIWVEPVDDGRMCAFFDKGGYPLNNRMSRSSYGIYKMGGPDFNDATSYMEI